MSIAGLCHHVNTESTAKVRPTLDVYRVISQPWGSAITPRCVVVSRGAGQLRRAARACQ